MRIILILGVIFILYGFGQFIYFNKIWEPHKANVFLMEKVIIGVGFLAGYRAFKDDEFVLGIIWNAVSILFYIVTIWRDKKINNYKTLIIGGSGTRKGNVYRPWEYLNACECGEKHPEIMIDENNKWDNRSWIDEAYIMCPKCGIRTEKTDFYEAMCKWQFGKLQKGDGVKDVQEPAEEELK